jgi:peptide/nickel transport system permease protein
MGLGTYIIRRLLWVVPTMLGVSLLIFGVTMLFSPRQRAGLYINNPQDLRGEGIEVIIQQYRLDAPPQEQYFTWLGQVLRGNLGWSETSNSLVLDAIITKLPRTAEIVLPCIPLIILFGVYLGVQSATHRDTLIDHATRVFAIFGWSLPTFWLGIMLLAIFSGELGWFLAGTGGKPLSSAGVNLVTSKGWNTYTGFYTIDGLLNGQLWITLDALRHLVLPTMTLTIISIALIIRIMRSSMLETLGKNYIITARAKGLKNSTVINRHARRNALIPVATISGLLVAGLLTGVVITETIFGIDGLGRWAARSAGAGGYSPDIPAVLGFAMFTCIIYITANLIVDILYAYLDPRIRLG